MNTLKTIRKRRSVRDFKSKKPDWRTIIEAIDSARYAPMAGGFLSLKFMLVDDKTMIDRIANWSEQEFIKQSPYLVVFISDPKITQNLYKGRGERYMRQQAGAAIENFLLHLTEVGLDSCWVGHYNDEKIKQILKIPEDKEIEAICPIGYSSKKEKPSKAKGNIDEKLYFNEWKNERMRPIEKIESRSPFGY